VRIGDGLFALGRGVGWHQPLGKRGQVVDENLFVLVLWCGGRWSEDLARACRTEAGDEFPWAVPLKTLRNPELIGRGVNDGGWFLALSFNAVDHKTAAMHPVFFDLWNPGLFGKRVWVRIGAECNPRGRYVDFWAQQLAFIGEAE
jgi:hypothetical protein